MYRISGLLLGLMLLMMGELVAQPVQIIPLPVSIQPSGGVFVVDGAVGLLAPANNKAAADVVRYFSNYIDQVSGVKLPLTGGAAKKRRSVLYLAPTKGGGEEGYQLSVTSSGVVVQAKSKRGGCSMACSLCYRPYRPSVPTRYCRSPVCRLLITPIQVAGYDAGCEPAFLFARAGEGVYRSAGCL